MAHISFWNIHLPAMIVSQNDANNDHRKSKIFFKIDVKSVGLNSKNSEDLRITFIELE